MSQSQDWSDMRLQGGLARINNGPGNIYDANTNPHPQKADVGSHEALSSGPPLENGTPTNYDYLWDIHGDHEDIEGWPFVSSDQIRRYFANRDFSAYNTAGYKWAPDDIRAVQRRRNPFCEVNTRYMPCTVGEGSYTIPHSCIYQHTYKRGGGRTTTIVCKGDACVERFHFKGDFIRHLNTVHDKQRLDCPVPGCKRAGDKGFSREDNLLEHRRKVHKQKIPRTKVRFGEGRSNLDEDPEDVRVGTFELADEATEVVDGSMVAFRRIQDECQ